MSIRPNALQISKSPIQYICTTKTRKFYYTHVKCPMRLNGENHEKKL